MNKIKISLICSVLMLASASPVFAGGKPNNKFTPKNTIITNTSTKTKILQTNITNVQTGVLVSQNTGGVESEFNLGSTTVKTGDTTATVKTVVSGSANTADVNPCGCVPVTTGETLKPEGNNNTGSVVITNTSNSTFVSQFNMTDVGTQVGVVQNTGLVEVEKNLGKTEVTTGDTTAQVTTKVTAPVNVVM